MPSVTVSPATKLENKPALALLRLDRLRRDACRPEGVGEPGEIGDAEPFDGEEDHAEGLRHEGQAEHDGGQIGQVAEHQAERHEQRRAEAGAERAGDQRGDARAGNGCGDGERAAIGDEAGKGHDTIIPKRRRAYATSPLRAKSWRLTRITRLI